MEKKTKKEIQESFTNVRKNIITEDKKAKLIEEKEKSIIENFHKVLKMING